MKTIRNIVQSNFIRRLVIRPIMGEFSFFCLFALAISIMPIRFLPSHIHYFYMDRVFSFLFLDIPRALAISYLLTLCVYYSRMKVIKVLLYALGTLLYTTCLFLHLVFHKTLQPDIIILIAETNTQEATEFFSSFLFSIRGMITVGLLVLYLITVFVCEKNKHYIIQQLRKIGHHVFWSILLVLLIVDGMVQFRIFPNILSAKSVDSMPEDYGCYDSVTTLFYSLYSIHLVYEDMRQAVIVSQHLKHVESAESQDSLNVIFVIGESYIKHHSQLYGYELATTPYLLLEQKKGNLFVFDNVVTPFNQTSLTMKNTLCCNSLRAQEKWSEQPYFPAIFKKAGYDVYFWDVQKDDGMQALFEFSLNSFVYDKELAKVSYTQISKHHFLFDDEAVNDFSKEVKLHGKHHLVMFHLMGQHVEYSQRYPHHKGFDQFTDRDIRSKQPYMDKDKKQMVAAYDNATLYNDYVLKHIIDLFRDQNSVVVYFSDHGEEVYDYRDSFGRLDFDSDKIKEGLKYQYEIPFMIWCSNQYMEKNPFIVEQIKKALHRPFRTDDICQVLFHLSHLQSAYYKAAYDLLNPHYQVYDRMVGEGMFNYDRVIKGN